MHLDIRLPIGAMFATMGAILTVYGAVEDTTIYRRSLGVNVNLYWGLVLLAFGIVMLLLDWNANRRAPRPGENSP